MLIDLALDPLGRIWTADLRESWIHVFEPTGAHVRSIGGKGAGPREFDGIAGMDWGPDGHLWVVDRGNRRYAVYDTAGVLVTTHPRSSGIVTAPWTLGFDDQGQLYDQAQTSTPGLIAIARHDARLLPTDTFLVPQFDAPKFEVETRQGGDRFVRQAIVPFVGFQVWKLDRQGNVWVGVTDRYRLERHRFSGEVDRVVERRVDARAVTDEERRRAVDGLRDFERSGGRIDASRIPSTHTVFDDFFFADDGHLWIKRSMRRGEGTRYDVYDPDGTFLGSVATPERISVSPDPVIRGGVLVGVVRDDDGLESVVVYRIDKPTP